MNTAPTFALLAAVLLTGCAGQTAQTGGLFDGSSASLIDVDGQNAMAHPWTAAGLPDADTRAFVLAVDPKADASAQTVKLPSGNGGVIGYGVADDKGCRSVTMEADFRDTAGKVRKGERVSSILCPPTLFGAWSSRSVTEVAQATIAAPAPRVAMAPPPVRRPQPRTVRATTPSQTAAPKASPAEPVVALPPEPLRSEPAPTVTAVSATAADAKPAEPRQAEPAPVAAAPAPAAPAPVVAQTAPPKAPSTPVKADPAPWKPAIQTDL